MVVYSQNDPRWKNLSIGKSVWKMGPAGCLITSLAVEATALGHPTNPAQMLQLLEKHNLINSSGDLTRMDALAVLFPDIELVASRNWPSSKADLAFLTPGTIIEIDDSPARGLQTHFMPVSKMMGNDVQVMDVWDGVYRNVSAYGKRWNPVESTPAIIYGAWKYGKKPASKPVTPKPTPIAAPAKPLVAVVTKPVSATLKEAPNGPTQTVTNPVPKPPVQSAAGPTQPVKQPDTPTVPPQVQRQEVAQNSPAAGQTGQAETQTGKVAAPATNYYSKVWGLLVAVFKKLV